MNRSLVRAVAMFGALGGVGSLWVACGNGTPVEEDTTPRTGMEYKFVVNEIKLPMARTEYAIDLNGDGNKDNQLGNIIGALTAQNLDAQKGVNDSLSEGSVILLVSVKADDATLAKDDSVGVTFYIGTEKKPPDFSGMGMFTVDTGQAPAVTFGKLAANKFNGNDPVTTKTPAKLTLKLSLIAGAQPLTLVVNGAHIAFTASANGLMAGQLHGSINKADIDTGIVPAVASLLTKQIADNPMSDSSKQILSIFDTGGSSGTCMNKDGSKAAAMDKKIDICEVAENTIIMNVLAPDVQIYNPPGTYAPQKANTMKDSLSLGLGFGAVKATF